MAHCFRCGTPIPSDRPHLRRKVNTGEWVRRDPRASSGWTVRQRLSSRIVCATCARHMDGREAREARIWAAKLATALVAILLAAVAGRFGLLGY